MPAVVGGRHLALRQLEAEALEERQHLPPGAVINYLPLRQQQHVVEQVVRLRGRLQQRHQHCTLRNTHAPTITPNLLSKDISLLACIVMILYCLAGTDQTSVDRPWTRPMSLLRPLGGGVRAWRWWVKLRVARTIWKVVLESSPARRPGVAWT